MYSRAYKSLVSVPPLLCVGLFLLLPYALMLERTVLVADAKATADNLRGEGEGEATNIYAKAFGQDPAFFSIWRTLQGYHDIFDSGAARLVVSPDNDYLKYLQAPPPDPSR